MVRFAVPAKKSGTVGTVPTVPGATAVFEEVIKHSTENHGSLMLKVKYLELNPSSGHYGYKSHNFNVIPEKIKALVPVCS